jgi:hypothetical protein
VRHRQTCSHWYGMLVILQPTSCSASYRQGNSRWQWYRNDHLPTAMLVTQVHVDRKTQPVQRLTFTRADKSAGSIKVTKNHLIMRLTSDIPLHSTAAHVNACELPSAHCASHCWHSLCKDEVSIQQDMPPNPACPLEVCGLQFWWHARPCQKTKAACCFKQCHAHTLKWHGHSDTVW